MYCRTLWVLMWKNWLTRKREYFSTLIEFVMPVLPFLLVFGLRDKLFPPSISNSNNNTIFQTRRSLPITLDNSPGPYCILYTPETNFTRILMGLVAQKLNLQLWKTLPNRKTNRYPGYFPFTDASSIFKYTIDMGYDESVVIFHNISEHSWPDSLSYSIRMKTKHDTYILLSEIEDDYDAVLDSNRHVSLMRQWPTAGWVKSKTDTRPSVLFLQVQWAIDSSFIQLLTGEEVKQGVTLKHLPHLMYAQRRTRYAFKSDILFFAAGISVFPVFHNFMLRNIVEKANGVQDLMKTMGVTRNALFLSYFLNALIPGLIYSIGASILLKLGPNPVLTKSSGFLIWLALFLQYVFTFCAAIDCSYIARRAPPTALTVSSIFLVLALVAFTSTGMNVSKTFLVYPLGLAPYAPLSWILKEATILEALGFGLKFDVILTAHTPSTGPAIVAYINVTLHIIICLILFWYMDHVIPGFYGSTHKWNFLFKKEYWHKPSAEPNIKANQSDKLATFSQDSKEKLPIEPTKELRDKLATGAEEFRDPMFFEKQPKHLEVGIKVINVTKDYGRYCALKNLSLDVYKDEITILLGHNGAGKSTLISVIAGMTDATKGTVLVNGIDVTSEDTRQHIGLCPQHNMFFENVTVFEHVMFFALLHGGTFDEVRKSTIELLNKLNLNNKAKNKASELTTGMKRRLQLACALAGQTNVLLLDEPTSGIDLESRRTLWNLILALRGSHTVLLSTHFMEEADAVGDRVVALHAGQLYCHATPFYLKRAIGSGYRLTFTTVGLPNEPVITSALKTVIPEVTVMDTGFNSISYNLPSKNTKMFPTLFAKIESMRTELGIDSIGVGTSSLERVILKLCNNPDSGPILEDETRRKAPMYKKLVGAPLYFLQMLTLMKRYLRFLWVYKLTQLGLGVFRVIIVLLVLTAITNTDKTPDDSKSLQTMNLDVYKPGTDYKILYKVNGTDSVLRPLSDQYPLVHFERTSDIGEAVLRERDEMENNNVFAAIELDDIDAKVLYTTKVKHAAPAALNLISNLIVTRMLSWAGGRTLTTYNDPLTSAYLPYRALDIREPKSITNIKLWLFSTALMLLSGIIFLVQLPSKDMAGSLHIHTLAGCPPELNWLTMLLVATIQTLFTYVVTITVACTYLEEDDTFSDRSFLIAASLVVILGCMALLAFSYEVILNFGQTVAIGIIGITMFFFVLIYPILVKIVPFFAPYKPAVMITIPPYTFNEAMAGCVMTAYLNALCKLNRDKCPNLAFPVPHFNAEKCCGSKSNPWCYFCFQDLAPGKKIIYLIVQIFFYMLLVILTQRGLFSVMWEKTINFKYKAPPHITHDDAVNMERLYVEETIKLPPKQIPDMVLVSDVHKNYQNFCNNNNAVKGVSFSVKRGECFGLLGVDGSGKSSMFRLLTGEKCSTKGRIIANGIELDFPLINNYLYSLGYCPQSWNLDDFLTGRQNLDLILALNGLNAKDRQTETTNWIKLVGLEKYQDQRVSGYSAGCLRRMAAAAALCICSPLTLLDEPTTGVDVTARRLMWFALKRSLRNQHAIIITSHSLDEMEALCHRISIMAAGEICALGSPAALRAAHASGHSVVLKIKFEPTMHQKMGIMEAANPMVNRLKASIEEKFKCFLMDEHKSLLRYHINDTLHYSLIFELMEELKASFSELIEDYSVSETTLEEVFLSFSKPLQKHKTRKDVAVGPA